MTKKGVLAFAALALSFLFTVGVVSAQTVTPTDTPMPTGNVGVGTTSGNTGVGPASGVGGSGAVSTPDNAPSTGLGGTAH